MVYGLIAKLVLRPIDLPRGVVMRLGDVVVAVGDLPDTPGRVILSVTIADAVRTRICPLAINAFNLSIRVICVAADDPESVLRLLQPTTTSDWRCRGASEIIVCANRRV